MCPTGSRPVAAFSGPRCPCRDFAGACPVQGAEVDFAAISRDLRALHEWFWEASSCLKGVRFELEGSPPPLPGWRKEEAGMCFQTRMFDPSFWRGKAGQVELQMDPADPISFWWQRTGKVRAVRQ